MNNKQEIDGSSMCSSTPTPANDFSFQPMDTAPKDRDVLLLYGDRQIKCFWSNWCGCWLNLGAQHPVPVNAAGDTPQPDGWRLISEVAS